RAVECQLGKLPPPRESGLISLSAELAWVPIASTARIRSPRGDCRPQSTPTSVDLGSGSVISGVQPSGASRRGGAGGVAKSTASTLRRHHQKKAKQSAGPD